MAWCPPLKYRQIVRERFRELTANSVPQPKPQSALPASIDGQESTDLGNALKPLRRSAVIVDTPNFARGAWPARPDWAALLADVALYGTVVRAVAVVNRGCPRGICELLKSAQFNIERSTADDLDDTCVRLLAEVAADTTVGTLVLAGGDHIYKEVLLLARAIGKKVVVVGIPGTIARVLTDVADEVRVMPVLQGVRRPPSAVALGAQPLGFKAV